MHLSSPALGAFAVVAITQMAGCRGESPGPGTGARAATDAVAETKRDDTTRPLTTYEPGQKDCGDDGRLRGQLFGAVRVDLDWRADGMSCEGMPRPHGEGARLRFSGSAGEADAPLAIIIAMPSLERDAPMTGVPSNVTIIEEGRGRFFSTTDLDGCWTDVAAQTRVDDGDLYRIEGVLYCISPLVEVGGRASLTIDELTFVGRLGWEPG